MEKGTVALSKEKFDFVKVLKKYAIVFVMFLLIIFISVINPKFLLPSNILNTLVQTSIYGIMALGLTFIIITKGIDLSAGSIVALAGVVAASVGQAADAMPKYFPNLPEMHVIVPVAVGLLMGMLCGLINGSLVAFTGIPPFIATLGMTTIARGFALIYTGGQPISRLTKSINFLGQGTIGGFLQIPILIYVILIFVCWILLHHTRFGTYCFAIGGNVRAAEVSGINVKKYLIKAYVLEGFLLGAAAIVYLGRTGSMHPAAATGYELTAIAATTIGGTSQSGGAGTIWGAVVGALIISILRNGMTLMNVSSYWQNIAEGVIIIVAVIIDMRKVKTKK